SKNAPRSAKNFRANSVLTRLSKAALMHRDEPRHVRGVVVEPDARRCRRMPDELCLIVGAAYH
ncbi:hypothetical protein ALC56_00819, partial [Trachymyrmex septentrionalis]